MKVEFVGQSNPLALIHGKEYEVLSIECGWYRIVDESGEDYLYRPDVFEVVEKLPEPPTVEPTPMPDDMRLALHVHCKQFLQETETTRKLQWLKNAGRFFCQRKSSRLCSS